MLKDSKEMLQRCAKVGSKYLVFLYKHIDNTSGFKVLAFPSTDLKLKLQKAIEEHAAKESNMKESIASLIKEKDKLLYMSIERGRVIQV